MSKNAAAIVRNPLDISAEFGTDAMRCAFLTGLAPGNDSKLTDVKLEKRT